jgi:hypothetical protein
MPKSRPVLIVFSILSGLDVLFGGAALGNIIGVDTLALCILGTKAVQVGMTFYVQGTVTPTKDVAAYDAGDQRGIVAGPAAAPANGVPVDIVVSPPPAWEPPAPK